MAGMACEWWRVLFPPPSLATHIVRIVALDYEDGFMHTISLELCGK